MKRWNFATRDRIGIAAAILLVMAGVSYGLSYIAHDESIKPMAVSVRIGLPMFFLWLAWPDIAAFPRWMLQASIPVTILVAIYPQLLWFIIPAVLLMMFLQPKQARKKKK
ncbi:MAG: hypothetical protein FWC43_04405 [Planctomycetaceae bacterium]|nr:hypothetical protein [Planctomycetaceae bacterium]